MIARSKVRTKRRDVSTLNEIRIALPSAQKTHELGRLFGALFLHPLVTSEDASVHSVTLSGYGPRHSGKTSFLNGCTHAFSDPNVKGFFSMFPYIFQYERGKEGLFRHNDFGPYFFNHGRHASACRNPLSYRKMRPEPGVDFLEHTPLDYLDAPGAAIVFPAPLSHEEKTFEGHSSYRASLDHILTDHKQIASAQQLKIRDQLHDYFSPTSTKASADRLQATGARTAIITLHGENTLAQRAFHTFYRHARRRFELAS